MFWGAHGLIFIPGVGYLVEEFQSSLLPHARADLI
jgi:hypothetical protein